MFLTKSDFIHYLNCPKSMWLSKRDPEVYPSGEFSAFRKKLVAEGAEVERYFRQHFEDRNVQDVKYEKVFEADGLHARVDGFQTGDGDIGILYEVKSATGVKTDRKHNYLKDACFQKICVEHAGQRIGKVVLVHVNGDYVRMGDIVPGDFLVFEDITDRVERMQGETESEIEDALALLRGEIEKEGCACLKKSRGNHCDSFSFFNPNMPTPSIYSLPRITGKKLEAFVDNNTFDLLTIPEDTSLTANQRIVFEAARTGFPQINREAIKEFLESVEYPLFFLDYEAYGSAVPFLSKTRPHQQFPFQYSLHILQEDGGLEHREYLEREARLPDALTDQLRADIGDVGSVIAWHADYEASRNKDMAEWFPNKADFLLGLNERMVDLEKPYQKAYVDIHFDGSSSIKNVLPVICPDLTYEGLEVKDGTGAMVAWRRMLTAGQHDSDQIAKQLLEYCRLDTLAMVKLFQFLKDL